MPEGPEIHLEARKVHRAVAGRDTTEVWCALNGVTEDAAALSGRRVEKVVAKGKAMLTHFEGDRVIYSHNQLYGKWFVKKAGELPKTNRSLRLAIHTETRSTLLYSASEIEVLTPDQLTEHTYLAKLGPDPLDLEVESKHFVARLRDRRFAGRLLAAVLLDQAFAAGLGNYLRAEILHVANIDPRRKGRDLTDREAQDLSEEILRITRQSFETRGITNDLGRVENLKEEGKTRSHYRFAVYKREGKPCYLCDTPIRRQNLGGRAIFWCPGCQN